MFEDTTAEKQSAPTLPPDPAAEELWEQVLQDAEDDIEEDVSDPSKAALPSFVNSLVSSFWRSP